MGREDKFYTMCTTLPFEEIKDERNEMSVPEIVKIAEARDEGRVQEAIEYGKSLIKMYPDNDLIPFMIAYIYYQRHFSEDALRLAVEAIPSCPRKYRLYSVAGLAEFDRGKLAEALVWWSRSVIAQCTVADFQEHDAFLYLGGTAEVLGMKEAEAFYTMSDVIEPSKLRLSNESFEGLKDIKDSWAKKPFKDVVKYIYSQYLNPG